MANNVTEAIDEIVADLYETLSNETYVGKSENATEAIDKMTKVLGGTGGRSANLVEAITKCGVALVAAVA